MIKQILVKDESSDYDLSYRVYTPCSHWKTTVEDVEIDDKHFDQWLRCDSCGLVLETLSDLRNANYEYDHE